MKFEYGRLSEKRNEEIYPTLSNRLNGAIDGNWVKTYLKNSMYPLMYLFEKTVCRIWIIC